MTTDAATLDIEVHDDIYNSIYFPYLDLQTRTQIFYGGSSSGKSFFLAQRCVEDLIQGGRNYLIVRNVSNTLRTSTFNELKKAIVDYGISDLFQINKSDMVVTCTVNGYQAIFKGLDDEEKIKSVTPEKGVITDIWVEEATECKYEAIKQLNKRLRGRSRVGKRLTLSFNPIYKTHWIFEEYFKHVGWSDEQRSYQDDYLSILKTTYVDNEWLEADDIHELENEKNEYYRDVYTYGKWGVLGDVIFTNWRVEDLSSIVPTFDRIRNGLDFGYSSDPNAFVRCHYDKKRQRIYIFNGWYKHGLTNPQIADELKPFIGQEPIFCDSAEPKSIVELQAEGIDARAVKKGPDSILHGIKWLQRHEIVIDSSLQHVINEFTVYQWKKDKDGNSLPIPEDKNNHCFSGDTLITTSCGYVRIDGIKIGDMVMTRKGYRRVVKVFNNGVKEVRKHKLLNGKSLVVTDTHDIITSCGKVKVNGLSKNDNVFYEVGGCRFIETVNQRLSYLMAKNTDDILRVKEGLTEYISSGRSKVVVNGCMSRYGKVLTVAYRMDVIFIIKMVIPLTILYLISFALMGASTFQSIQQNITEKTRTLLKKISMLLGRSPRNGTEVKKGKLGTLPMVSRHTRKENPKIKNVSNAEKHLKISQGLKRADFVQMPVNRHGGVILGLMMRLGCVLSAAKNLLLINTRKEKRVVKNVHQFFHTETVYDLMIEGQHEYFANGLLVSNCIDATRYALETEHSGFFEGLI